MWWTLTNAHWYRNISGLPSSWALLSTHATLFVNPDRPSENSPCRFPCVGFQTVNTVAICTCTAFTVDAITGLYQDFRKCGLPCGLRRSLCTLQWCCSIADVRNLCPCFQAHWSCCRPFFNAEIFSYDGISLTDISVLLHHCNTRYEWLVRPCSAETCTLQETPSFAWRTNGLRYLRVGGRG